MSKSSRNADAVWSWRRARPTLVGIPGAPSIAFDIVRASRYSTTIASYAGTVRSTCGETPVAAAARALCSSLARSIASSSVDAPGIRSTTVCPSTRTR